MAEEKPKSKKMLIIIVAVVLVLLLVVGGVVAALMLSGSSGHGDQEAGQEEVVKKKDKKKKKDKEAAPVFEKLEVFTVNLVGDSNEMLQTELNVELHDEHMKETLKSYMPKIRNNVILLLSSKKADELKTPQGKQKLIDELKKTINDAMGVDEEEGVQGVTLSSFILQ